jgi:hypothetical protein
VKWKDKITAVVWNSYVNVFKTNISGWDSQAKLLCSCQQPVYETAAHLQKIRESVTRFQQMTSPKNDIRIEEQIDISNVRFQVFTAVTMKNGVF